MKKSLLVFSALVLCAAIFFAGVSNRICRAEDKISVTAQTLYGDPSAAAGITITERTQFRSHLLWETEFAADTPEESTTDFSFLTNELHFSGDPDPSLEFMFSLNGGIGSSGDILSDTEDDMYYGFPLRPAMELAEETSPGEANTGKFVLSDYYEYLPYSLNYVLGTNCTVVYTSDLEEQMHDYFRFRTPENLVIDLELTKDPDGKTTDINYSCDSNNAGLATVCTMSDDGFYFAFSLSGPLDFSEVPGGFGIYHLPVTVEENGENITCTLLPDHISTIYSLDPERYTILDLEFLQEQNALCFFTLEEGRCWMNLMELESNEVVQRLEISGEYESGLGYPVQIGEGFILLCDCEDHFTLLSKESDRSYRTAFSGSFRLTAQGGEQLLLFGYDSILSYDGQRLAIATFQDPYHSSGFYLSVFEPSGLVYAGRYLHSQDAVNESAVSLSDRCVPTEQEGILINFI